MIRIVLVFLCLIAGCSQEPKVEVTTSFERDIQPSQWQAYGGDHAGSRYAAQSKISVDNVDALKQAWVYRTGDANESFHGKVSSFKATPILFINRLFVSTGLNRVHAIDPATGEALWVFDPKLDSDIEYSEQFTSRGVSAWSDTSVPSNKACADRIYLGTLDARLFSLDAKTGEPCENFGDDGEVDLSSGANLGAFDWRFRKGEYAVTSPPVVVNGVVIVGSSIGDNGKTNLESGVVRAFNARTGEELWHWDPIPRDAEREELGTWEDESWQETGAANVWTTMSADPELNLVYLPTTSPSPDFYGGKRLGDNKHANSIVALDAASGEFRWAYQAIKHDLWDYDLAAQPLLVNTEIAGESRKLLVQAGKTGFIYILDRITGLPVFPIEERTVPQTTVPGERSAKTQRFPGLRLHPEPTTIPPIFEFSKDHTEECGRMFDGIDFGGIFTPPSLNGTLLYPGNPGGVNWGSMALYEPDSLAFVVVNRWPTVVTLMDRDRYEELEKTEKVRGTTASYTEQEGAPFGMARFDAYRSEDIGVVPCFEGPWSTLVAIDVKTGTKKWEIPAGSHPGFIGHPVASTWGSPINQGGPMATAGGLVFLGTRYDAKLHAYDVQTGRLQWSGDLPAQAHATPMSYAFKGSTYVVVAAGGWDIAKPDSRGDHLIAYRLN